MIPLNITPRTQLWVGRSIPFQSRYIISIPRKSLNPLDCKSSFEYLSILRRSHGKRTLWIRVHRRSKMRVVVPFGAYYVLGEVAKWSQWLEEERTSRVWPSLEISWKNSSIDVTGSTQFCPVGMVIRRPVMDDGTERNSTSQAFSGNHAARHQSSSQCWNHNQQAQYKSYRRMSFPQSHNHSADQWLCC